MEKIEKKKREHHIKKFRPLSVAKTFGIIYGIFGFFAGIVIALDNSFKWNLWKEPTFSMLGPFSIIVIPIVYGLSGFIAGILTAWLYNIIAKYFGGIEIEVE